MIAGLDMSFQKYRPPSTRTRFHSRSQADIGGSGKELPTQTSKISKLEKEEKELKAKVKELQEDLSTASKQLETYSNERKELKEEISKLKSKINAGPGSIIKGWVFSPELKWIYLSPSTMPYAYSQDDGWMMYEYGTNPRRVYYFKTKEWKILKNEK